MEGRHDVAVLGPAPVVLAEAAEKQLEGAERKAGGC